MSLFQKTYLKLLKEFARESRKISGGKIKAHLRQATKSHAQQATRRKLHSIEGALLSDHAKAIPIGREPLLSDDADELLLYLDNDHETYRHRMAVQENLTKKILKGTYHHGLAPKAWLHVADFGSQRYKKEIGVEGVDLENRGKGTHAYTLPIRQEVANLLAWRFIKEASEGEYNG